ncbi:hypothetical protein DOTSEDRAFT_22137 [Dothistroma septosporum NZE10]|uniref:CYTH domain-containing protein n=1 Tax=Dothistroma septosporum (strain NZE10 / CBS 128990) TaxID=675120 RepID=N1PUH7_DOTSN|nr:hypothetical protein DOTSEDRAFT_22137 [Dothistroma septosporum NZE10]
MFLFRIYRIASPGSFSSITGCRTTQRRLLSHISVPVPRSTELEVESKFNVTALLRSRLDGRYPRNEHLNTSLAAATSLLKFTRQPDKLINDQYFDDDDTLCSRGIWVRRRIERTLLSRDFPFQVPVKRSLEWEAKIRVGGDCQSSQFEEVVGEEAVMNLVKQHVSDLASLHKVVDINTLRKAWTVREHVERALADREQRMMVVIDSSTAGGTVVRGPEEESAFHHMVGEVELTLDLELGEDGTKNVMAKRAAAELMKTELDMFMKRNSSLFPTRPAPVGKLTAYFAWKQRQDDRLQ